ncbi:NAD(P)-dependent oxidoreductase [Methylopila sp. Yamaguchi]|uniref:NAD(P)-dependent oxidoreductase n=1 Tax=Methylopila sp. Yamaguchi TaxID=1437817 RepID=UPI000CCA04E8|nr:NAD(P)-dependent oxidoreductase [Methylopila sp. Yamaguchi]GBD49803.1 putative 6-phosphogluconate dehydrogenase [Methylopila sp. Yamaguchi]
MTRIGFIGLGSMGLPMAANLVAAGFDVRGFDMRPAAMDALGAAGGEGAGSAADAAADADALMLMVVNAAQARAALIQGGSLAALPKAAVVVLMATCPPAAAAALGAEVTASGRRFVDAPVSGGVVGARSASLTIMAAAPKADYDAVAPALAAMGSKVFHVGETPGQGATVKALNQLLCGVHLAAAAEALSLAKAMGVAPAVALEILGGSAAASWMLRDRGPRMLEDAPEVTSAVDIFVKDLGIVLEAGRDARAALPLAALAHQMFLSASGRGAGDRDDSQVIQSYDLLNRRN